MHVVIVGCGRVGSALARELVDANHTVAIIDRREEAFGRLDNSFTGQKIVGIGFDRDVLATAGIQHCDAVAAVTSGDNSNILIARVARENFGIERVVARIYDPQRAAVYQRLGIATVATVSWTTERVLRRVLPPEAAIEWVDPSANVSLVERQIEASNAGRKYTDIEDTAKVRIVAVARLGAAMLTTPGLVAQEGDLMYLAVTSSEVDSLNARLNTSVAGAHA
jgi:trk system potassium uptake protein TrkA